MTRAMPPGEPRVSGLAAASAYLALSILYFGGALLPGNMVFGTDTFGGGYAFYELIARELASGRLPSWIPHVYGGLPLFANPGSTFYPVHLVAALLLPAWKVFPAVMVVQFWLAGLGTYLFARELGCRAWVAFLTGAMFQFTGVTLSWIYGGHDGRIIVATLAPLALALLYRGLRTGGLGPFAGAAATLGAALLSFQIQVSWYLLVGGGLLTFATLARDRRALPLPALLRRALLALAVVGYALVLSAVNFLPFSGYVGASPRGAGEGRGYEYSVSFSAAPSDLVGLLVPEQPGSSVTDPISGEPSFPTYRGPNPLKLHTEYVGVLTVLLVLSGAWLLRHARCARLLAAAAAFFLSLTLGGHTPLYRLYLAILPGLSRFRAPDLALYMLVLCLTVIAGLALEALARSRTGQPQERQRNARVVVVTGVLVSLLGLAMAASSVPSVAAGWLRVVGLATGLSAALLFWVRGRLSPRALAITLTFVALADLWSMGRRFFFLTPPPSEVFAEDPIAAFLRTQPQPARAWVLPIPEAYGGGGNRLMRSGLHQLGGEHPVPLQRYVEYLGTSLRATVDWRNLIDGPRWVDTATGVALTFQTRPALLDAANVQHVVTTVPLAIPGLREVFRGTEAGVYENLSALPRVWLVSRVVAVPTPEASLAGVLSAGWRPRELAFVESPTDLGIRGGPQGQAELIEYAGSRLRVRTRAEVPTLLVVADNHYDGWIATVDGTPAEVLYANHTFRGVPVPAGNHRVELEFRPWRLAAGGWISVAGWALLGLYGLLAIGRARRR